MQHSIPEFYTQASLAIVAAVAIGQAVGLLWPTPSIKGGGARS